MFNVMNNIFDFVDAEEIFAQNFSGVEVSARIKNCEDKYLIEGIFPGMKKRDIIINYKDDYIFLKAKGRQYFANGTNNVTVVIDNSREFVKNFYVPESNPKEIKASFENYKLYLEIPKMNRKYRDLDVEIIDVEDFIEEN